MKKRLLLICGILILVAVIALEATNAMNKGSTNTEEVISKPNKMAEPAQSTAGIGSCRNQCCRGERSIWMMQVGRCNQRIR